MTKIEGKNATINDLADRCGISVMTVSRYFNQPWKVSMGTKKKIEDAIRRLNYHPNHLARSLSTRKSFTLGVVVPDIRNPFFNTMVHEIDMYVTPGKYNLLLCNTQENGEEEIRALDTLLSRAVDGIIIAPVTNHAVEILQERETPFVLVDRDFENVDADYIGCDHYTGMCTATEHLLKLGHRDIALFAGPLFLYPFEQRMRAYRDTLTKYGIEPSPGLILQVDITDVRNAFETCRQLLVSKKRPTAIIASNNNIGSGVFKAILDSGLSVPDDISLIVFDKISGYDIIRPKITCIVQPLEFIGRNAAAFILERINNPEAQTQRAIIMPELLAGDSCRRIAF